MTTYIKNQYRRYLVKYLEKEFGTTIKNSKNQFTCPICKKDECATIYPNNPTKFYCLHPECNFKGDIFDLIRKTKNSKFKDNDIIDYLNHKFDIEIQDEIDDIFRMYEQNAFSLFPIAKGTKIPTLKEWQKSEHKNPEDWKQWIENNQEVGLNIGTSNVCVIDFDDEKTHKRFKEMAGETLIQSTTRGWHYVYEADPDFFKTLNKVLKDDKINMELRVAGAFIVVAPSSVNGEVRKWNNKPIAKMPEKFKEFFMKYYKDSVREEEPQDDIQKSINEGKIDVVDLTNKRNDTFIKLAGILRKQLSKDQTKYALQTVSYNLIDKPIPAKELRNILGQVDKYNVHDKKDLANKILSHLKVVDEGSSFEIATSLRYEKKDVEDALRYLIEDGSVLKRGKNYSCLNKAEWKSTFVDESKILDFKVPYFNDYAVFRNGDMIVIGGKPGSGKSVISMNIIRKLVDQNIKPYYINLESGNRFVSNALKLGLKEDDFYWTNHYRPQNIELEDNAVTLLDWLLPDNYAETDKLYARFSEQLDKHKGLLFVFVQLKKWRDKTGKEHYDFFAPNQLDMFPAFVTKYSYGENNDNTNTLFETTKVRESKSGLQYLTIPTKYNLDTKRLELRK